MSSTIDSARRERSDVVHELNQRIREIAGDNGDRAYPYTFVCECGCWGETRLTLGEFDRAPRVFLPGHAR